MAMMSLFALSTPSATCTKTCLRVMVECGRSAREHAALDSSLLLRCGIALEVPNYKKPPVYLVEPLVACIKGFQKAEAMDRQRQLISQQHEVAGFGNLESEKQVAIMRWCWCW